MKWRILLLDGEEEIRTVLASFLERAGYTVTATDDIGVILELSKTTPPDLILTSVYLPGMSGHEAVRFLRVYCPRVPVLMLAGLPDCRAVQDQMVQDGFDLFPQAFHPQDLLAKIHHTLGFGIRSLSA